MQLTLARSVSLRGVALHSGADVAVDIHPAPADQGISFQRTDASPHEVLRARHDIVEISPLCTRLRAGHNSISTIEHMMAAFAGLGIDNARVLVDGPELPILDGSALPYAQAFQKAGLRRQRGSRHAIEVMRPVRVDRDDGAWAELCPSRGFQLDVSIDFPNAAIGSQRYVCHPASSTFVSELAPARTFCQARDIPHMRAQGLALGGSSENALIFDAHGPIEGQNLRFANEPVRHKILDAIGDLYLIGAPIQGAFKAYKPGHALTNLLLRALIDAHDAWRMIILSGDAAAA